LSFIASTPDELDKGTSEDRGRLQAGADAAKTRQVERVIEAFATEREIAHKIDDDFPEIAEALWGYASNAYQVRSVVGHRAVREIDPGRNKLNSGSGRSTR